MKVLVTGANGFLGQRLCESLLDRGHRVRAATRDGSAVAGAERVAVGAIGLTTRWDEALDGVDAVIHAAARVHVMHDTPEGAAAFREVNELGTSRLADAAVRLGVPRFVFVSTLKVTGDESGPAGVRAIDAPAPVGAYAESKLAAERILTDRTRTSATRCVIVRPPLVYGPGVRANFQRLVDWVAGGVPLPFGALRNRRSLISVWNLCDLLARAAESDLPSGTVLLASDGEDVSTPELVRRIGHALGRPARLWSVPPAFMLAAGRMLGRSDEVARLCGSLWVDLAGTEALLGWRPPLTLDSGLARTVAGWRTRR
jgi:nucleoside-diphosphate-sugar epimerase